MAEHSVGRVLAAGFHARRFDRGALHGGAEHDPRIGALGQRGLFPRVPRYFKKSTLLWLILLAALALLGADVYILRALFPEQLFWLVLPGVCFALWLMVFIWAFPLTATFENTLWNTIKNAVLLGVGYLPRTLLMAVIHLLPVILFAVSPAAFYGVSVLWLVLLSAVTCYTDLWLMQKPFAPFLPDETE